MPSNKLGKAAMECRHLAPNSRMENPVTLENLILEYGKAQRRLGYCENYPYNPYSSTHQAKKECREILTEITQILDNLNLMFKVIKEYPVKD